MDDYLRQLLDMINGVPAPGREDSLLPKQPAPIGRGVGPIRPDAPVDSAMESPWKDAESYRRGTPAQDQPMPFIFSNEMPGDAAAHMNAPPDWDLPPPEAVARERAHIESLHAPKNVDPEVLKHLSKKKK